MRYKIMHTALWLTVYTFLFVVNAAAQCPAGYNKVSPKTCFNDKVNMRNNLNVQGNVGIGIGNTVPSFALQVQGAAYAEASVNDYTYILGNYIPAATIENEQIVDADAFLIVNPTGDACAVGAFRDTLTGNIFGQMSWSNGVNTYILRTTSAGLNYTDSTEGAGKVLTSDASGNASWQNGPGVNVVSGADTIPLTGSGNYTNTRNGSVAVSSVPLSTNTPVGAWYFFMNEGSNNYQIDADNTLDFYVATTLVATINIPPGESRRFYCNGVNWFVTPN